MSSISLSGDIYLIRNIDIYNDLKKMYWQHAAMSNGWAVIEGQREPGKVIMVTEDNFRRRNPERVLLRPKDANLGKSAAIAMEKFVGSRYNILLRNCVTYIRFAYWDALHYNPGWFYPDDIYKSKLFDEVEYYKDYDNWHQPDDWYEGRLS